MLSSWRSFIPCALLTGIICGCSSTQTPSLQHASDRSEAADRSAARGAATGSIAPAATDFTLQSSEKYIGPLQTGPMFNFANDPSFTGQQGEDRDKKLIRDEKTEAYLRKVANNLLACWRGPKPQRIGVFVYANSAIAASASPHGDIFISSGAFNRFTSEDELALIMGHELGHLLLNHHESNKAAGSIAKVAEIGTMIAVGYAYARNSTVTRIGGETQITLTNQNAFISQSGRSLATALAVKTVSSDIGLHAFARQQEYAADLFGVQLARNAGYDPTAMTDILDAFRAGDALLAKRQQALQAQMPSSLSAAIGSALSTAMSDVVKPLLNDHPSPADRDKALKGHFASAGWAKQDPVPRRKQDYAAVVNAGRFKRVRRLHDAAVELGDAVALNDAARRDQLMKEVNAGLADASPDVRLVLYAALRSSGDANAAYKVLAGASTRQKGTIDFYRTLASEHAEHRSFALADDVLKRGDRDLGAPAGLLPTKIAVARLSGDATAIQRHLAACQASKDDALIKVCSAAVTGADPEEEFKSSGGLLKILASGNSSPSTGSIASVGDTLSSGATSIGSVLTGIFKP